MVLRAKSELIERVVAFLRERGGESEADEVCRHVLGFDNCAPEQARLLVSGLKDMDDRVVVGAEGTVCLRRERDEDPFIADVSFAVLDLETTGLPSPNHRIIEFAAVVVESGKAVDDFSSLVNPGISVPRRIQRMTGITNEMLTDAPPLEQIAGAVIEFLGDRVLVAHNSPFDVNFLNMELNRVLGIELANKALCTVRLTRTLIPGLPSYRLGAVADYFNIEIQQRHRALGDAAATADVFVRLCRMAEERGTGRLSQILKCCGHRIGKFKKNAKVIERSAAPERLRE